MENKELVTVQSISLFLIFCCRTFYWNSNLQTFSPIWNLFRSKHFLANIPFLTRVLIFFYKSFKILSSQYIIGPWTVASFSSRSMNPQSKCIFNFWSCSFQVETSFMIGHQVNIEQTSVFEKVKDLGDNFWKSTNFWKSMNIWCILLLFLPDYYQNVFLSNVKPFLIFPLKYIFDVLTSNKHEAVRNKNK